MNNLRALAAVSIGLAATATAVVIAVLPKHHPLAVVPRNLATLTQSQRVILKLARKDGVGSGILYVWGGTTTRGFDCSGFIWHVLRTAGVHLNARTSYAQFQTGTHVPYRDLRPGDVVFFVGSNGSYSNPGHVGLYLRDHKFVEYYRGGFPARYSRLPRGDYAGARRYWKPERIRKRTLHLAIWVAHRWHLRIAGHHGDTVVFIPRRHHHHLRFPRWKRRAILSWAHHNHHRVIGHYSYINIRLWPR